ncbi:TetR/AcrR family transcriptional regulator [Cupriavidus metallidurans]|uniref:TetR/AcrR family transcriptional regulator n=1 Tax=Cupriavidus TaxID=106589 RepID=UPI0002A45FA8|nr:MULTISPECIES: TetR/AcrR family transcriptional regulator [Cupriavidus]ELA01110.1 TetR family transcriptional regulator [Cupriavidus sp. HMR-1]GMG92901.1 hypothetical protein Cmtc_41210 [Cupriavidus sp. TKC]HBO82043.1 TetR/AcrR family transcriptional regulator [Cupriavidus sp.]
MNEGGTKQNGGRKGGTRKVAGGTTKPAGQWHHGDLRASLIAWGLHLLDTQGIAAMSMREAAKLAGVSPGAPAHHFQDRNGLLAAIAAQAFRELGAFQGNRARLIPRDTPANKLRALLVGYAEFAHMYPARFHLMFGPAIERRDEYPELQEASSGSFDRVRETVVACLGGREPGALTHEQLAFCVWTAAHGLATLTATHDRFRAISAAPGAVEQMADTVATFCLAALQHTGDV